MSEEKKPFTVSDRRHFTAEGEVRKADADEAPAAPSEGGVVEEGRGAYPADFLGLLISLGAQASTLLVGGPEGEPPDLESARALIELLGVLKEKTEGRRTPEEDQLLGGLLYELRMAYVQARKAGGP